MTERMLGSGVEWHRRRSFPNIPTLTQTSHESLRISYIPTIIGPSTGPYLTPCWTRLEAEETSSSTDQHIYYWTYGERNIYLPPEAISLHFTLHRTQYSRAVALNFSSGLSSPLYQGLYHFQASCGVVSQQRGVGEWAGGQPWVTLT